MSPAWEGDERRGIPIHVLNHVDERLGTHVDKVEKLFSAHTDEEMERYQEILDMITQNRELIERNNAENIQRHNDLCRSVESYTEKTEKLYTSMTQAFIPTPKGEPDFHGHARAHESWVEERAEQKAFMAYIKKVVASALATALTMWLGVLVWQGVLQGPK